MNKLDPAELQARLKQANEQITQGFQTLPDNPAYHFLLEKVELGESKSKRPMVTHTCRVLSGDNANKTHRIFSMLDHDVSLRIMLQMWRALGLDTDTVDSVEVIRAACEEITKRRYQFIGSLVTNDQGYQNTRVVSLVSHEAEKPAAAPAAAAAPKPAVNAPKPAAAAAPVPASVEEEVVEEEAETEFNVEVGTKIAFTFKGEAMKGEVNSIDEPNATVLVKAENGKKYKIKADSITGPAK